MKSTGPSRIIACTNLIAAATGFAAIGLAGPASADGTVLNQSVGVSECTGGAKCGNPVSVPFTTTQPNVEVSFTKVDNSHCPDFNVLGTFDGVTPVNFGSVQSLPAGNHTISLDAECPGSSLPSWGGTVQVSNVHVTGAPPGGAAPAALPKEGPTVSWQPIVGGLRAKVTDRSGVTSECKYESSTPGRETYDQSFALGAHSTENVDIVPAVPAFQNWDVTITCDNGTKTETSTFF